MAHAWLDSLSEDWISQPGSDASQLQLPGLSSSRPGSNHADSRDNLTRISRFNAAGGRKPPTPERSTGALSERSLNDVNIPPSHRTSSRPSRETKASRCGRPFSRSVSASSSSASVLRNTVQQKSHSASPSKNLEDIPEWKKRLVYGYLSYGESKDLFSSAATGLENIFRPPPSPNADKAMPNEEEESERVAGNDTTLPSSPPPYPRFMARRHRQQQRQVGMPEQSVNASSLRQPHGSAPKHMNFRRTKNGTGDYSRSEISSAEKTAEPNNTGTQEPCNSSFTSLSAKQRLEAEAEAEASRKTSGQSIIRNEGLSPILVPRHNSEGGNISFGAVDLPAEQLRNILEDLRRNQRVVDSGSEDQPVPGATVPEGSEKYEDTADYAAKGGFLNLRRRGRSRDGSFRLRPQSPPVVINTDTSEMLPESSIQASTPKQMPTVRTERLASGEGDADPGSPQSPTLPRAPHPSPEKRLQPPPNSSGSPLKLFGPYDTFTNQTLLRRISQFEDQMAGSPPRSVRDDTLSFQTQESPSRHEVKGAFVNELRPEKAPCLSREQREIPAAISAFGAGELDGYEFSEDITINSSERSWLEDKENLAPEEDRKSSEPIKFHIDRPHSSDGESLVIRRRRQKTVIVNSPRLRRAVSKSSFNLKSSTTLEYVRDLYKLQQTPKRDGSEGKRPRTSPSKDPTPKRRRTLHQSDIAYGLEDGLVRIETVQSSHRSMQSAIGKKLTDIYQDDIQQLAVPDRPGSRRDSRPRSPTPNQRPAKPRERQPLADIGLSLGEVSEGATRPQEESEILVRDFAVDGSRKSSMRTQDFFDAAEEIMAMIRSKARPKPSLDNIAESEGESAERRQSAEYDETEDSFQESTKEPVSRPPSRERPPLSRMPTRQENPEIANRLKQYEEVSDLGDMTYSMQSMAELQEVAQGAQCHDESSQERTDDDEQRRNSAGGPEIVSGLSNVRISRNPSLRETLDGGVEYPSSASRGSGNTSARSFPTGSSRGSDSRRLIGPDAVTGLIGDQVGNMVFDKDKKIWVKVKTPKQIVKERNVLPSEDSEEDPFASIPDLSVDTLKETANLRQIPGQELYNIEESFHEDDSLSQPSAGPSTTRGTHNSKRISSHIKETFARIKQSLHETLVEEDEEIEHEITIHEGRIHESTPSRRRNLTITFSSPIASIIRDMAPHAGGETTEEEPSLLEESTGDVTAGSLERGRDGRSGRSASGRLSKSRSRSRSQGPPKNLSVKAQAFVPRPVSRIDERDEDSTEEQVSSAERQVSARGESSIVGPEPQDARRDSLSVVVTPAPPRVAPPSATPMIAKYVGTLSLSPLSEFTMNHGDQSCALELSYVVGDRYLVTGNGSRKVMSKAVRSLVEKITEVEPFEPDWDSMRELDISNKQLTTLHKLDEFCANVVTLDASSNSISHLDGVPESVRNLRMTCNQLSELTAWGHLINLQYVDVSNNQLNSLHPFKELVHLRNLRADNNQIASLDGINLHDSLQVLRVRGNLIEKIDFDGTRLHRLTELDLEGNQISSIQNIDQLPCLATLNLQNNWLTSFDPTPNQPIPSLRYLKLSDNDLVTLDLSACTSLRLLHADRNQLATLTGFSRCRRLDSLSLREQRREAPLDTSFLASAYEVRKLFLSGNNLSSFTMPVDFLNLQYLELANCGLETLPPNVGQLTPNLRVLNLNFNALADLAPLRYIPRLKKLLVVGNRLTDAAQFTEVLAGFPHLARLDARDNPATLGFYPPPVALVPVVGGDADDETRREAEDPFALPDVADADRDRKFLSRLDMGTRMRRRLYEMVVLERCRRLKVLDGLLVDRETVWKRDAVWDALLRSGVVSDAAEGGGVVARDDSDEKNGDAIAEARQTLEDEGGRCQDPLG
ncbi:hypothetical protein DL766_006451 [Monosporascus sp. MC13-8B]|uniref:Adenylate cyclase n=1 Tax=Monosporascus cannonballus TaxID=155416 RepID=A0ABY0GZ39_9PEZI|nr:hypothetical protein DL762_008812 [Monosporascus cannonballus]RYP27239.1 hypothetical protein DL766_006451 [Monosporascus sp. MC13-8B]